MQLQRRWTLRCAALLWLALLGSAAHAQFTGFPGTVVRFATIEQGQTVLGADDEWVSLTSEFQRASTMKRAPPVSVEAFRKFSAGAVLAWSDPQQQRWRRAMERLAPRFAALNVPLPPEVLLISTTGDDAANAPYTRANAVILPAGGVPNQPGAEAFVLAHELFHVVSRHAPELASRLYATIGFEPVAPLQWPVAWLPARITNPDAPYDRHLMRTTYQGRPVALMPLLMAGRTELKPGESFFSVMEVRLLEVMAGEGGRPTLPVLAAGQPVWHAPKDVPDYMARLGGNTAYILHPEETIADNFSFVVNSVPAPNRELLQRIEAVLQAPR